MSKHTPAPWEAVYIGCGDWDLKGPVTREDWRLAAAALELLEAATKAFEALNAVHIHGDVACVVAPDGEIYLRPVIDALRQVIAKATGETK